MSAAATQRLARLYSRKHAALEAVTAAPGVCWGVVRRACQRVGVVTGLTEMTRVPQRNARMTWATSTRSTRSTRSRNPEEPHHA